MRELEKVRKEKERRDKEESYLVGKREWIFIFEMT